MHQRGEVYWVEELEHSGSEMRKKRPWVIIGINAINRARSTIIAIPLSTSASEWPPLSVKVSVRGRLVVAICDQIRAIDKKRFLNNVDKLSAPDMNLIEQNLSKILGLG